MAGGGAGRRWAALSGGVLINGLILATLALVEEPSPIAEEPVITLELRAPERRTVERGPVRARSPHSTRTTAGEPPHPSSAAGPGQDAPSAAGPSGAAAARIDPAWRVDPQVIERWRVIEGAPLWKWGRYDRACKGLSSEHMTDEEKDSCYGGWLSPGRRQLTPKETRAAEVEAAARPVERSERLLRPDSPTSWARDAARQEACRAYRGIRTQPGADPSPSPALRRGGCF